MIKSDIAYQLGRVAGQLDSIETWDVNIDKDRRCTVGGTSGICLDADTAAALIKKALLRHLTSESQRLLAELNTQ